MSDVEYDLTISTARLANLNSSLDKTTDEYKKIAEERAQKFYDERVSELNKEYEEIRADWQAVTLKEVADYKYIKAQSLDLQDKVKTLEATQLAYIQMKKREEEMRIKQDYYRPLLADNAEQEIKLLRDTQLHMTRKDAIDKVIWECYYKPAYNALMSRLCLTSQEKTCGIYKITCVDTDKPYIGQSVDIRDRFKQHIRSALSSDSTTNKLYQEMKKYGPENFTFEIVEEIPKERLNDREKYWIEFYRTCEWGLNSTKGGS